MTKEFYSLDEIQKYYDEKTNTYVFKEDGVYIPLVIFNFRLNINANIDACNIKAWGIKANNIDVHNIDCYDTVAKNINADNINAYDIEADDIETNEDIKAWNIYAKNIKTQNIYADNIYAHDISYWALCFATQNIECHSIKGRRDNHKCFVLDGYIAIDDKLELKNKSSKALKIIKEKNVDIEYIKTCFFDEKGGFNEYNAYVGHDEDQELSQEEYDLLKEVLEDE